MANAKPSRPETPESEVPAPAGPSAKAEPTPAAPGDGYYRTRENVVVWRQYEHSVSGVSYSQYVAQGPQGQLPEGVTNADVTNDE